ncbi:hypothetical protein V8J88_05145 [Massilia sp. W12]|uniref:hypothetical protein n=1 Tax=Massilia sp. W12 TaxID=3126507 RepID=UPI0030D444AD
MANILTHLLDLLKPGQAAPKPASAGIAQNQPQAPARPKTQVTLRNERTPGDSRYLGARIAESGDLLIEGQDIGAGVEEFSGSREYEWAWLIAKADLPKLSEALHAETDLLAALQMRFSGPAAAELGQFLTQHGIHYESWSRIGD